MSRVVTWEPTSPSLPRSVVAIGVFDGVHLGHQALLAGTVADAAEMGAASVAITFDRDPDQVVTPEAAAPQLLTLADKLAFIGECGIDTVLVVPFTQSVAALSPAGFLDSVVATAIDVVSIHVGADFRFGAGAAGDVTTLETWATGRDVSVTGQQLVTVDGAPVTSTRIRALIGLGDVVEAAKLLGRPHRVTGTVVRGRDAGRALGFPTANVTPVPFAALPADGVYAGRALLPDGSVWSAAAAVGTPPTFPEARDYFEAHLIGFEGDLYGSTLTVEFLTRLRDLRAFAEPDELTEAISADVRAASAAVVAAGGRDVVAQSALDASGAPEPEDVLEWVQVAETSIIGAMATVYGGSGRPAMLLTIPLDAANIPYRWEPFPPEYASPSSDRMPAPFSLFVPSEFAEEARALIANDAASGDGLAAPAPNAGADDDAEYWEGEDITDEDLIEDESALAAAQAAVDEARPLAMFSTIDPETAALGTSDIDEWTWTYLLEGFAPGPIEALSEALNAAEIETLWDPFPPEKRAAFWGKTNLTVYVPLVHLGESQRLAEELGFAAEEPGDSESG